MADTSIEWTDKVWNPVTGCSKVSQGCRNCYAETIADRFFAKQYPPNADGSLRRFTDVRCHEDRLEIPLKWRKPQRVFVNSMSDLFHEDVPDEFIDAVFNVMALCPQHTFQVLTKRPERMLKYVSAEDRDVNVHDAIYDQGLVDKGALSDDLVMRGQERILVKDRNGAYVFDFQWPLPNVWLGVSVEDQKAADERIPLLLRTPAAVRWISAEPLLGPVDLTQIMEAMTPVMEGDNHIQINSLRCVVPRHLDWVVCGGESGPGARPMHPAWARSLRDQCHAAGVPFFFKQWGAWAPGEQLEDCRPSDVASYFNGHWKHDSDDWVSEADNGPLMYRVGKKAAGRLLDGREWSEYPALRAEEL